MPSQEVKLLSDFLLAPAALRDFMTLRQFTDIFPKSHRANPAVHDLYRELQRLRQKDIDAVHRAITDEVSRSKQLRREYAGERRRLDDATVAGLDPIVLSIEEEVSLLLHMIYADANPSSALTSCPQEATYLHDHP
jgi:centromere-localized protein 2